MTSMIPEHQSESSGARRTLNKEWPTFDPATEYAFEMPDPYHDIAYALDYTRPSEAAPVGRELEPFTVADVRSVERYDIMSNAGLFGPRNHEVGSELDMVILGELRDGRWFSLTASNDFTGWGCAGDDARIRIGTRDDVINYGLDSEGRARLGFKREGYSS